MKMKTSMKRSVLPLALFAVLASCSGEKQTPQTTPVKEKVKVEIVNRQDVEQLKEFTATVEANIVNKIAPQAPVRIQKLHVEVGDHVRSGQLLATMDATSLKQTKIQMENQRVEFMRMDELYKVGGVSKSTWDAAKAALDVSREAYNNLLENNQLVSPVAGVVTARNYDNGDMYTGQEVYVVEQIEPVKLLVYVSESYFTQVKKGMPVEVKLDVYGEEAFNGKVSLVHPTIDPSTRTFPVEIRITNTDERIRPGMFARVTMNLGVRSHVVVPDLAIVKQSGSGDRYVYVHKNGTVSYNKVALGRRLGDRYEVITGVEDGDQAVTAGHSRLTNGMEVEVIQ